MIRIDIAHKEQVDDAAVAAFGVVVDEVGLFEISQAVDDAVDDPVQADHLADHGFELREEGVLRIGGIEDLPAVLLGCQQVGAGELVQFLTDGVGGEAELFCEFPQIGAAVGIQKEPHQQLDPRFGGYQARQDVQESRSLNELFFYSYQNGGICQ